MALIKTRNKLVDVARQLFAKRGLDNTTMNDIAAASGKGRRTLYTYFKNKEEIYFARNGNLRADFFRNIIRVEKVRKNFDHNERKIFTSIVTEGVRTGVFDIESIPLFVDILHFSLKGLEIPYIYGRLGQGVPKGMNRAIVQKMVHKLIARPERRQNLYL